MAFKLSNAQANVLCNSLVTSLAGTTGISGTASLNLYSGSQPASANDEVGTGNNLLCTIEGIGWKAGTAGTASLASSSGYQGTASTAGIAGWGRIETINGSGTCRADGDVGTSIGNVFQINLNNFSSGGLVTLVSADIYMA